MHFADEMIQFERPTYPSAGCFILSSDQLELWINSSHFLDGDVSYMSPGDSAVTLSIMKAFRIYKPVLHQAWFLEVLHASPRWIDMAARQVPHRPLEEQLISLSPGSEQFFQRDLRSAINSASAASKT